MALAAMGNSITLQQQSPFFSAKAIPSGGAPPSGSPLVTAQTLGTSRTDAQVGVGLTFVAQSAVTITSLGRWVYSGNSSTHVVTLQNAAGVVLTTATVTTSGATVGAFKYATCANYTLTIGVRYFILSAEGGDQWGDEASVTCASTVTGTGGTAWNSAFFSGTPTVNSALKSYVPVSALYQ